MNFRYLSSFDRSFKKLSDQRQKRVKDTLVRFLDFYTTRIRPPGVGLKKLHKHYWEIRSDLDTRIIFSLEKDTATFILVGNHDEIRHFLSHS